MVRLIQNKFKSRRGISMVMALVFMLVSAAVGAVILAAASASTGHYRSSWEDQRDYFAVASAAKLLRDDIKNLEFTGTYVAQKIDTRKAVKQESGGEGGTPSASEPRESTVYSYMLVKEEGSTHLPLTGGKILTQTVHDSFMDLEPTYKKYFTSSHWTDPDALSAYNKTMTAFPSAEEKFTLQIQAPAEEGVELPPVEANLTVITGNKQKNFTIKAELYVVKKDSHDKRYKSYVTSMVFEPELDEPSPIYKGGDWEQQDGDSSKSVRTSTFTHVLKVTWKDPKITRGAIA